MSWVRLLRSCWAMLVALSASLIIAAPAKASPQPSDVTSSTLAAAPKTVTLNSTNSKDITNTEDGAKLLSEFSRNVRTRGAISEPRTLQALTTKYRVTSVNVADILPDPQCRRNQETLILPKTTAEIRYMAGSPDPQENANPCLITVAWDDAREPAMQDDPQTTVKSVAVAPYSEMYQGYCASRKVTNEHWYEPCYQKYVTKYDGNSSWNYYAIESYNTCVDTNEWTLLVSCGRGQQVDLPASAQWLDRAPMSDQLGTGCRSISLSLSMGPISLGGSTNHCDLQKIYVYPEAGKMSSYWKGDTPDGTRATRHRASVKVGQNDGRPEWTNWFNAESCRADLYPLSCP